ncbi:hypothetical protein VP01_4007g2 [Puccinia sorghi]|uniref:Uncharacterized protein n=1 Tax=Puccinia sorghi TaxID=27349 RepID=A0A0L6UTV2_9BASI|nr:hypothetical protein VP01_4007g2 [Puccinia sorghi]
MAFALPAFWSTKLQEQLCHLKMGETETFVAYSMCARTAVKFGLPQDLKTKVHDFQLLLGSPFKYSTHEQQVASFDENLPRREQFHAPPEFLLPCKMTR